MNHVSKFPEPPAIASGDPGLDEYRRQISECARALAVAKNDRVAKYLAGGAPAPLVKMFTDGNLDKRFLKLQDQLELVAQAFGEDFEELIAEYVRTVPLAAYDTGCTDGERFLEWLGATRRLTVEQQDYVACQRSRHAVEFAAAKDRLRHLRFQELAASREMFLEEWGLHSDLWIHLNPIRVWATFRTPALLEEGDSPPATVLFFPVGSEIRTAVLEPHARALVRELEARGPCRLDDLAADAPPDVREEIAEIGGDLAELGLAAFG